MVFRKKTYRKRPFRKSYKKKTFKAKKTIKAFKKKGNVTSQVFRTKAVNLTIAQGIFGVYDFSPSISNIPAAELTAYRQLYDEYKIVKIKLEIIPRLNQSSQPGNLPFYFYNVIDKNDSAALPSVNAALEYNNCQRRLTTSKSVVNRTFVPSLTTQLLDSGGLTFNVQGAPRWIQMDIATLPNNINISHLGMKVITDVNPNPVGTPPQVFDVYETLLVQFRTKL